MKCVVFRPGGHGRASGEPSRRGRVAAGEAAPALAAACLAQVMVEAYRRDAASKDQLVGELRATKKRLDAEVKELRRGLAQLQGDRASVEAERSRLQKELSQVRQQMAGLEGHLAAVQRERDQLEAHLQVRGHVARGGAARAAWGLSVRDAGGRGPSPHPTRAGAGSEGRHGVPGARHGARGLWAVRAVGAAGRHSSDGLRRMGQSRGRGAGSPVAGWGRGSEPAAQRPVLLRGVS